jgi:hypothetical protein
MAVKTEKAAKTRKTKKSFWQKEFAITYYLIRSQSKQKVERHPGPNLSKVRPQVAKSENTSRCPALPA